MPKKEIDYSNTIIYKLCCKNPEIKDIYVGHTTDFRRRKCQHKTSCNDQNSKIIITYINLFVIVEIGIIGK